MCVCVCVCVSAVLIFRYIHTFTDGSIKENNINNYYNLVLQITIDTYTNICVTIVLTLLI